LHAATQLEIVLLSPPALKQANAHFSYVTQPMSIAHAAAALQQALPRHAVSKPAASPLRSFVHIMGVPLDPELVLPELVLPELVLPELVLPELVVAQPADMVSPFSPQVYVLPLRQADSPQVVRVFS
jgi:hypothetical protein